MDALLFTTQELFKSIEELVLDKYGRKTLLYLLSPRDPLHFVPDIVHVLQQGDTNPHRCAADQPHTTFAVCAMTLNQVAEPATQELHCSNAE